VNLVHTASVRCPASDAQTTDAVVVV